MSKLSIKKTKKKQKTIRHISAGRVYIKATFNNTIVTITDEMGNTLAWSSAGNLGFKGARKATPYAAQQATESALEKTKSYNIQDMKIFVCGVGPGRESAIRVFYKTKYTITSIKDLTPMPHNGCRAKNPRRV